MLTVNRYNIINVNTFVTTAFYRLIKLHKAQDTIKNRKSFKTLNLFVIFSQNLLDLIFTPSASTKNLIQIQCNFTLLNQTLNFFTKICWENPHQGLGSEPVLGPLLVVALGHVGEHEMSGLVDVVDDLAKVGLEVSLGEVLQVGESCGGNVPLPLQVALAALYQLPQVAVRLHELDEAADQLEVPGGDGALAALQRELRLLVLGHRVPGEVHLVQDVAGEHDQEVVLVDVVHDLGLEEGLGGVIHDLVAQLGLGDVLPQLLDARAAGLLRAVLVYNLIINI